MARPKQNKKYMEEMKDILILYEQTDSEVWAEFIQNCFSSCPQRLTIDAKDLKTNITNIEKLSARFSMILVIVSNEMLKTMEARTVMCILDPILHNHLCVSVIKLYIEQELFADKVVLNYHGAQSWKCHSVGNNDEEDHVQHMISEIIDMLQKVTVPEMQAPPIPSPTKSRIQSVCPECIRQGGESMTVVLRTPIKDGQCVQINIGGEKLMKIDTVILNPYCFTFKAPAHKAGKATLRLYIDGQKIAKKDVQYSSMVKFAYSCPEFLCQLIGLNPDDKAGLDKELMHIFNTSSPQDGSLQFLLSPKNLQAVSSTGTTETVGELPTLLHFACMHGLNDLAVSVINTPGSHIAIDMDNDRGLNPLELAREVNNEELVHYLESYVDMHDYVTDIELLYEKMSGGKQLESYMNADTYSGASKSKYLEMHGGDSVEEAYIEGRLPKGIESDYEITSPVVGVVEEVEEKDDVPPEVPERRPSVNHKSGVPSNSPDPISHNQQGMMQDNWETSGSMPKDDLFGESTPMSPASMGSLNLDDLNQYAEAYRRGDFSLEDVERLCNAWHERNREMSSCSLKQRKKQLDDMKDTYKTVLKTQKAKRKKSILPWKKKETCPEIEIQHNVQPNQYMSWTIMRGTQPPRVNCDSTISNTSTTSSSSSSSHDSALGPLMENSSDSDASNNENVQNRESWGIQYLQNRSHSRLPKPPPHNPVYVKHRLQPTTDGPAQPPRPPKPEGLAPAQPPRPLKKRSR